MAGPIRIDPHWASCCETPFLPNRFGGVSGVAQQESIYLIVVDLKSLLIENLNHILYYATFVFNWNWKKWGNFEAEER